MSQITRCPSCSTSFKVVADQLRISEGWVRCGHCKEVFDAAAHLLPAPPPPLLPDVSLTDVRPPPSPVVRKPDMGRAWGAGAPASPLPAAPARPAATPSAPLYAAQDFSLFPADTSAEAGVAAGEAQGSSGLPVFPAGPAEHEVPEPVLAVPDPAVPAFLAAPGPAGQRPGEDLQLEPLTPFGWRSRPAGQSPKAPASAADGAALPEPAAPPHVQTPPSPLRVDAASVSETASPALTSAPAMVPGAVPAAAARVAVPPVPDVPAGYELPFADLRDDEEPLDMPSFESTVPAELTPMGYPALELPIRPIAAQPSPVETAASAEEERAATALLVTASEKERAAEGLPPVDFIALPAQPAPSVQGLALVEDDSPAAVLQAKPRKKPLRDEPEDDEPGPPAEEEVSFVVAARRKAFWRKPAVRAVLVVIMLVATLALALQVAVQERDRIAAMDARARPWLMKLCAPLQCEIAPQRQIADVVIDSSSFNKARGDSYQLTVGMKSKASVALAMPAVELTLTDAQDQPVLRRVLLPADMGAPAELPARGEWSTAVSVVVTTGGARVAGYRLLAFYP
ncbi:MULTISPECIES: zinc-ribbon and DUF3426 domain-containing protein [unclassified Acidovorax]|uniref:zinc-ribbon and DUF3426 domain-containing protein n=1 Tax=unclassified Acidovorax TaxID=2684926 RepID=UPI0009EB3F3D|nr:MULTISPECIES: zinc-ribbon and DUF3426 domain-containing protein [unclassified Acidovorax]